MPQTLHLESLAARHAQRQVSENSRNSAERTQLQKVAAGRHPYNALLPGGLSDFGLLSEIERQLQKSGIAAKDRKEMLVSGVFAFLAFFFG
jgi:hypothetical protein